MEGRVTFFSGKTLHVPDREQRSGKGQQDRAEDKPGGKGIDREQNPYRAPVSREQARTSSKNVKGGALPKVPQKKQHGRRDKQKGDQTVEAVPGRIAQASDEGHQEGSPHRHDNQQKREVHAPAHCVLSPPLDPAGP